MTDTKSKKTNQWLIDRAYNMKVENADRTYKLLSFIKAIKDGKYTEEEGMKLAADEGCVVNLNRYKQSTATGLRCFGLVSAAFETTEIAEAYLNKFINFNDLILLQLIKKETKYDENADVLRPLFIILKVLLAIREMDSEQCWIDGYDYFIYLTEIKKYSEINAAAAAIVSDRSNNRVLNFKVNDYDIWVSALLSTNLFVEVGNAKLIENTRLTINDKYLHLIKFLVNNESKMPIINEYEKNKGSRKEQKEKQELYGLFSNGLYTMLPKIELNDGFTINNLNTDFKKILYLYLFEGMSFIPIERTVLGEDGDLQGFFAKKVIDSFGIKSDYKGIWKPFINNIDLIKNYDEYKKLGRVYDYLFGEIKESNNENQREKFIYTFDSDLNMARNLIVYGTPGCGKSYYVKNTLIKEKNIPDERVVRTTFYQDYTNTDFVGQVMPKIDGEKVTYEFNPGPFTIALRKAIEEPDKEVVLVIEELNRGNAPSIFGDIFQLLDRKNGLSEYSIVNINIQDYLNKYFKDKGYIFEYIKLSGNLSIYATMNTSDQNVFTLDTAFKRRWEFKKLSNKFDENHTFSQYIIPGMPNVTWKDIVESVNDYIAENSDVLMNEDKQIGVYFVEEEVLVKPDEEQTPEKVEAFAHKLLEYLWDDVVKYDRSKMFKNAKTFDQLVADYKQFGEGVFVDGIIKQHN